MKKILTLAAVTTALTLCAEAQPVVPSGTHTIVPYLNFKKYEEFDVGTSKALLVGFGYKFTQLIGYNFRGNLSLLEFSKNKENVEFELVNSYRFQYNEAASIFPILSLNSYVDGFAPSLDNEIEHDKLRIERTNLGFGAGVEKRFTNGLSLGFEFVLLRDLAKRCVVTDWESNTFGKKLDKKMGYQLIIPFQISLTEKMHIAVTPLFGASFGDIYEEQKLKASFNYTF